jgi:hypothetical protein
LGDLGLQLVALQRQRVDARLRRKGGVGGGGSPIACVGDLLGGLLRIGVVGAADPAADHRRQEAHRRENQKKPTHPK